MTNSTRHMVVSACKSECSVAENEVRTTQLKHLLAANGIPYFECIGHTTQWGTESSLLVHKATAAQQDTVMALALAFQQDAVLGINNLGQGWLLRLGEKLNRFDYLGDLVTGDRATSLDSYTECIGMNLDFGFAPHSSCSRRELFCSTICWC